MTARTRDIDLLPLTRLQDECIGIFIGAGTSVNSIENIKMPQWNELLSEMLSGFQLGEAEPSPNEYLTVAGRIEKLMKNEIIDSIQEDLADNGIVYPEHVYADIAQPITTVRMAEYIRLLLTKYPFSPDSAKLKENSTLQSIIKVCECRIKEKKRTIIINYNFDDFLEFFLSKEIGDDNIEIHFYQDINDDLEGGVAALLKSNNKLVNIIYVHGKVNLLTQESSTSSHPSVVLSQQNYDILFRTIVNFTNQLQYLVMASMPCIAVGFSCVDPNFRQLRKNMLLINRVLPPFFILKYCSKEDIECPDKNNCIHYMHAEKETLAYYGLIPIIANSSIYASTIENLFGLSKRNDFTTLQCNV